MTASDRIRGKVVVLCSPSGMRFDQCPLHKGGPLFHGHGSLGQELGGLPRLLCGPVLFPQIGAEVRLILEQTGALRVLRLPLALADGGQDGEVRPLLYGLVVAWLCGRHKQKAPAAWATGALDSDDPYQGSDAITGVE